MKHYTAEQLREMPTLAQGQFADLKYDHGGRRVWLSRMKVQDGAPCDNLVTVEHFHWTEGWLAEELYKAQDKPANPFFNQPS
jgi:hypothetical protein